jgi:hypothetical protein
MSLVSPTSVLTASSAQNDTRISQFAHLPVDRLSSVAAITAGKRESGHNEAADAKMMDPLKIELVTIEQLIDVADPLGRRNQAFGSEPDADGLVRHLEKLGERRG